MIKVLKLNYSTWYTQIGLLSKQLISNLIVFAKADCNQGTVSNGSVTLQQIKFGSKNDYICHFFRNYEAKHKSKHLACNLMQTCINLTYFSWIYNQKWNIFFKWSRWLIKITYMFQSTMWILFTSAFLYFSCWKYTFVAYQFCLALPATAYSWNCSWSKFNWVRVAELGLAAELGPA